MRKWSANEKDHGSLKLENLYPLIASREDDGNLDQATDQYLTTEANGRRLIFVLGAMSQVKLTWLCVLLMRLDVITSKKSSAVMLKVSIYLWKKPRKSRSPFLGIFTELAELPNVAVIHLIRNQKRLESIA